MTRTRARAPAAAGACCLAAGIFLGASGAMRPLAPVWTCCVAVALVLPTIVNGVHGRMRSAASRSTCDALLFGALLLSGASLYATRHTLVEPTDVSWLAGAGPMSVDVRLSEARPAGAGRARAIGGVVDARPAGSEHTGTGEAAGCAGEKVDGTLWVSWPDGAPQPARGQLVRLTGEISRPRPPRNPGSFDFRSYLADRGAHAVMSADKVTVLEEPRGTSATARWVAGAIRDRLAGERADILTALLLGGSSRLSEELLGSFRRSGTVHVLAVSGLHVGFIALMAHALLRCFGVPKRWAKLLVLPCLAAFVMLVGARPSAVRAAIMASAVIVAWSLERRPPSINTIGAAAMVILVLRPGSLFDAGFALSFGATLGIVLLHPAVRASLSPIARIRGIGKLAADSLAVSVSAQLGVAPFALALFGEISLVAPLANLVAVPLAAFSVASGIAMLATAAVPQLSRIFAGAAWASLGGLSWSSSVAGHAAFASARIAARFWPAAALVAVAVGLGRCRGRARLWRPVTLAVACLVATVTWGAGPGQSRPRLVVFDVGQGDAILLELPRCRHVLVDTGPAWGGPSGADAGKNVVAPYLRKRGVRELEALVITHGHGDHYGGAASVLSEFPVRELALPPGYQRSDGLLEVARLAQSLGIQVLEVARGDTIAVGREWEMVVMSPTADLLADSAGENDRSVVIRVRLSGASALLTGDIEARAESGLVASGLGLGADILKVAHHGSSTSSGAEFVRRVAPALAVVSVGERNRYGHPDAGTISRLEACGARVLRTDSNGAVIVDVLCGRVHARGFASGAECSAPILGLGPEGSGPDDDGREPRRIEQRG